MLTAEELLLPTAMKLGVAAFFERNRRWISGVLAAGCEQGVYRPDLDVARQSLAVLSALQGAMFLARLLGDLSVFDDAVIGIQEWLLADGRSLRLPQ